MSLDHALSLDPQRGNSGPFTSQINELTPQIAFRARNCGLSAIIFAPESS
jgi:hypothetical protein